MSRALDLVARYRKALAGGAIAALAYAQPVVDDGLVASECIGIAIAGLTGLVGVGVLRNR